MFYKVPQECLSSMNTYCLSVTTAEGKEVTIFSCVRSDDRSVHLLVEYLMRNTSYSFSIISNNTLGQQSTTAILFCKENLSQSKTFCSL